MRIDNHLDVLSVKDVKSLANIVSDGEITVVLPWADREYVNSLTDISGRVDIDSNVSVYTVSKFLESAGFTINKQRSLETKGIVIYDKIIDIVNEANLKEFITKKEYSCMSDVVDKVELVFVSILRLNDKAPKVYFETLDDLENIMNCDSYEVYIHKYTECADYLDQIVNANSCLDQKIVRFILHNSDDESLNLEFSKITDYND